MARLRFRLRAGALDAGWVREQVAGLDAGAIVRFEGTVRESARGRNVSHLDYEAYTEMVEAELARIVGELATRHEVLRVAIEHATGRLEIGEVSIAVAVAAAHRAPAFAFAAALMDELKVRAPIWKKESYPDGSSWIGRGS